MSRYYEMTVTVSGVPVDRQDAVEGAANGQWAFGDCSEGGGDIMLTGRGSLCGGESEDEFVKRITKAIWKANGHFCPVEVCVTDLESAPYEIHHLDEDDFDRLQTAPSSKPQP